MIEARINFHLKIIDTIVAFIVFLIGILTYTESEEFFREIVENGVIIKAKNQSNERTF